MEVRGLNILDDSKLQAKKQDRVNDDAFSQLFAALFSNIQITSNTNPAAWKAGDSKADIAVQSNLNNLGNSISGSSKDDILSILNEINLKDNLSDTLNQSMGNADNLESILRTIDTKDQVPPGNKLLDNLIKSGNAADLKGILKLINESNAQNNSPGDLSGESGGIVNSSMNIHEVSKLFSEAKTLGSRAGNLSQSNNVLENVSNTNMNLQEASKLFKEIRTQNNNINDISQINDIISDNANDNASLQEVLKLLNEVKTQNNKTNNNLSSSDVMGSINSGSSPKGTEQSYKSSNANLQNELVKSNDDNTSKSIGNSPKIDQSEKYNNTEDFIKKISSTNTKEAKEITPNLHSSIQDLNKANDSSKAEVKDVANIAKPQDIVEVAVQKFKALRLPEITELKVKLRPDDLGEITVKMVLEKGQINGSIHADKKEVAGLIQSQMENLKQDLRNNNVNLNNISVNISNNDNYDGSHQRSFNQEERRNPKNFIETFEDIKKNDSDEGFNIIA